MGNTLAVVALLALIWLERRRPLRGTIEAKAVHVSRNLMVAGLAALTVQAIEMPIVRPLAQLVGQRRWGLTQVFPMRPWISAAVALLLLDYTLYVWHVLTHRVPWLWRLHLVHHVDLDLDASTALRFHAAELLASVPWRAAQVLVIGVSPAVLTLWQSALLVSILFHHSNVRLPLALERALNRVIVTPRMHGIHHSMVREETDSNWSSGLTVWDWLHGTLRRDVPQDAIRIGVPAYPRPNDVTLTSVLALPFVRQPPSWQPPVDRL